MPESSFIYQSKLASFCRTGELEAIPGINNEHISQYRRLVYNVVDDMLQNAYPLTKELLTEEEWDTLVTLFFRDHPCQSPQVWYMPKELITFLTDVSHPLTLQYPILLELLHFEWIEVELFMMPDDVVAVKTTGDILEDKLVLNPEHRLLHYNFPVHQEEARGIHASDAGHYFVIAHRNKVGEVLFTSLSPAIFQLLEYLEESPASTTEMLNRFASEYGLAVSEPDQKSIKAFFQDSLRSDLISGYAL